MLKGIGIPSDIALTDTASVDRAVLLRLSAFVSFLRENGFAVGIDDAALLVQAATHMGIVDKKRLRWSAKTLLCRRASDRQRFDDLFDAWFLPPNKRSFVESPSGGKGALDKSSSTLTDAGQGMPVAANDDVADSGVPEGSTTQHGATAAESLANADFRH